MKFLGMKLTPVGFAKMSSDPVNNFRWDASASAWVAL